MSGHQYAARNENNVHIAQWCSMQIENRALAMLVAACVLVTAHFFISLRIVALVIQIY
jgi:hypothetical protein